MKRNDNWQEILTKTILVNLYEKAFKLKNDR